jgi:hypothetical protein
MIWSICGMIGILAGLVVMVLGKVLLGLLLLLAGVILMAVNYVTMMRGAAYLPGDGDADSVPGRQQSEIVKMDQPVIGEKDSSIWEKMEK